MTTTVKDLINYLQTLPEDATVRVAERYDSGWDWSSQTRFIDLDVDRYSNNCNYYVFGNGDKILYLGAD